MDKHTAFKHFIQDITNHMTDFNYNEMVSEPFKNPALKANLSNAAGNNGLVA